MKSFQLNKTELNNLKKDSDKILGVLTRISSYIFARLGKEFYIEDVQMDADFDENYILSITYHAPIMLFVYVDAKDLVKWSWKEKVDAQLEKLYGDSLVEAEYPEAVEFGMVVAKRDVNLNKRLNDFKSAVWDYILNGEDELYDEICFAFQVENIELGGWRIFDDELGIEVLSDMGDTLDWVYFPMQTLEEDDWKMCLVEAVERMVEGSYTLNE